MNLSNVDAPASSRVPTPPPLPSFGELFRALRKQLAGKQACLSGAGLRCTDAAISHWERGHRLPRPKTMRNAIDVLAELGASEGDIEQLKSAWYAAYIERKVVARRRTLEAEPPKPTYDG
ncbi:MAG: helix-turn-helix transcriptional regulator [Polyangiaceae bacterium]